MSSEDKSTITINLFIIGDEGVGKKTFISRLNTMPCTKQNKNKNKYKPKEEKKQKNDSESEEEIPKKKEPIYIPPPSSYQLEYKLGNVILTIQGFIIDGATQCRIDEDVSSDDEDDEIVHEYHIKFTMTKKCILNYLKMLNTENNEKNINETIFLFMYDLSDFTTFERMMLYYDSINRKFKLNENKAKCFIMGNKSEKKMLLNKEDNEKMNSFYKLDSNFKKFEISNKLHFNFSKFLNELIENCVENDMDYDKEKLKTILENKFTFNKAKRNGMEIENDIPGPDKYNTDVYEFSSMEERNEILNDKKKRFNTKIFVNKQGPLIYINKKEEDRKLKNSEFEEKNRKVSQSQQFKSKTEGNLNNETNKKISYTMGGVPCKYNLKGERLKLIEKRNKEYLDSFGDNILSSINQPFNIKNKDEKYFEDIKNRRYEYQQNLYEERKNRMGKFLKLREQNYEKLNKEYLLKSQNYKDKYKEYDEQKSKQRFLDIVYGNNSKFINRSNTHIEMNKITKEENEKKYIPPQLYDTRGNLLNPKKGIIILGKRKYKDIETNNAPLISFKSDFDKIVDHKKDSSGTFVERYRDKVLKTIPEKPEKKFDEEKFKKYEENKLTSERQELINQFLQVCKDRKERHKELMKAIKEEEEEYHKILFQQYYKNNSEEMENYPPPINYNQIEEKAPSYSIKGRYEKKNRFINNNNQNMSYFSINGKQIQIDPDNLPNPNINSVKWKNPVYSFGTQERFNFDKFNQIIKDKNKEILSVESDENNDNNKLINTLCDRTDFSKLSIYDSKSQRSGFDNHMKNNPGPGQYKIKGFAEEIVEKYEKINNMKKLNELEKKDKDDKKNENKQNSITGTSINNYMNEFNDQRNEISRDKSQVDDKEGLIKDEIINLNEKNNINEKIDEDKIEKNNEEKDLNNNEEKDLNNNEEKDLNNNEEKDLNNNEEKDLNNNEEKDLNNNEEKDLNNNQNNNTENRNETKLEDENQIQNNEIKEEKDKDVVSENKNISDDVDEKKQSLENTKNENNNEIQNENQTNPDDQVQIKNEIKEENINHSEPIENNTKPNDIVEINNNNEKENNFEEPK